ncbi:MAG: helix-turn-helix transcriptional regulator [Clostridiales Family XIII bacterium]|jgi:transcriptional regulator with XRE-family HTH domain|nr:helix-turn-helix transcriptional regulator [Clostridiales Family XIII bacterium]
MTERRGNIYKICRNNAGLTQEQASEKLHIALRTLSSYENGETPVNDKMVAAMVELYKSPLLAWRHLKETSELGKYLPEVIMPQTNGDMAFQMILAQDDLKPVVDEIKRIMSDGKVGDDEMAAFDESIEMVKQVNAKLLSVIIYAGRKA